MIRAGGWFGLVQLPAPTADQPLIHKAMNDLSQVLTLLEQAENAAAANNQPRILADLTKATVLHANAKTIARRLELD